MRAGAAALKDRVVAAATGGWWLRPPWCEAPPPVAELIESAGGEVPDQWPGIQKIARWWGLTVGLAVAMACYGLAWLLRRPLRALIAGVFVAGVLWGFGFFG